MAEMKVDIDKKRTELGDHVYRQFLLRKAAWWHADKHQETPSVLLLTHQITILFTHELAACARVHG